jgi:hypothetical protein
VFRRSHYYLAAFICGIAFRAEASSVICSSATGTSNVFTNQSCSQMFTPSSMLDWGSPVNGSITGTNLGGLGSASTSNYPMPVGSTLNAAVDGDTFTISSDDQLERADNTAQAWNGTTWLPASFVQSNNYFAGHFGAPTTPTSQPQFGDNLLGALAPSSGNNGPPTITLTFAQTLSYIAFQVSSAENPNFTAKLLAFNSLGQQIGTYQVQDTGGGGNCAGLSNLNDPTPCNDAALIQFYDPTNSIKSVELVMVNDFSGVYIDELQVAPVPEPVTFGFAGICLLCVIWVAQRKRVAPPAHLPVTAARE